MFDMSPLLPSIPLVKDSRLRPRSSELTSAECRALLAYFLHVNFGLAWRQAGRRTGASGPYVAAVARLTPEQRTQLIRGESKLTDFANNNRNHKRGCRPRSNAEEARLSKLVAALARLDHAIPKETMDRIAEALEPSKQLIQSGLHLDVLKCARWLFEQEIKAETAHQIRAARASIVEEVPGFVDAVMIAIKDPQVVL